MSTYGTANDSEIGPEIYPAVTHYEMTLKEHQRERGSYVDPDRYKPGHRDYQPEMLCHTGDGHARGARNKAAVTCPTCRRLLGNAAALSGSPSISGVTYQEAMRDAHAQAEAASAQYNAAKNNKERTIAVEAIRAAEQACASAYAAWEADPAATW